MHGTHAAGSAHLGVAVDVEVGVADVVRVGEREDRVLDGVALGVRAAEDVGGLRLLRVENREPD